MASCIRRDTEDIGRNISGIRGDRLHSSGTFLPITSVYIQRDKKIYRSYIWGNIGIPLEYAGIVCIPLGRAGIVFGYFWDVSAYLFPRRASLHAAVRTHRKA